MRGALFLCLLLEARPLLATPSGTSLAVERRTLRPGEMILVVIEGHNPRTPPEAFLGPEKLDVFPAASSGTWLALAGIDLEAAAGPLRLRALLKDASGRSVQKSEILRVEAARFPVQELTVDSKYVTPPKSDAERAESEAAGLYRLFVRAAEKRLFEGSFEPPIPGAASSRFGERRVFNGRPRAPHSGMDLKAKPGTPVRAPASGRVLLADSLFFQGKTVLVDHGLGLTTLYAHLSRILVKPGDSVRKGQLLGKVGATGRATGPHLHWALKWRTIRVDPFSLTSLDLDSRLKPRAADPLQLSPACARKDLPPPPPWGPASSGLRSRIRPLKAAYAPREAVSMLVEIQNAGRKNTFLDLVLDPGLRAVTLGFNRPPQPYSLLAPSTSARLAVTQVKIPPGRILCFEQDRDAEGSLQTQNTSYTLIYGTEFLYASTSTTRPGLWRGRLVSLPAEVVVSTSAAP